MQCLSHLCCVRCFVLISFYMFIVYLNVYSFFIWHHNWQKSSVVSVINILVRSERCRYAWLHSRSVKLENITVSGFGLRWRVKSIKSRVRFACWLSTCMVNCWISQFTAVFNWRYESRCVHLDFLIFIWADDDDDDIYDCVNERVLSVSSASVQLHNN